MKDLLTVIVPAAGAGKRMGFGKNKAFITIRDIPLLVLCMKMLAETGIRYTVPAWILSSQPNSNANESTSQVLSWTQLVLLFFDAILQHALFI